jgi:oxygen-dependent protoporphyrinogen oxidase
VEVVTDSAASVDRHQQGFSVHLACGQIEARYVVLACQAYEAAALVSSMDPELAPLLSSVPYSSSTTVSLGYDTSSFDGPRGGFGFLVPKRERRRLMAGTWVGTKFPYRVPENRVLLRCFITGSAAEDDEALAGLMLEELREIFGMTARPVFQRVHRWPRSMAQYTVGHQRRWEAIQARLTAVPGLYVAGNAYTGIGVSDCARMGKQAAEAIIARAASPR